MAAKNAEKTTAEKSTDKAVADTRVSAARARELDEIGRAHV